MNNDSENSDVMRPSHLDVTARFQSRNGASRINNTVKRVSQVEDSRDAKIVSGVSGVTRKQTDKVCRSQEYFCEVCEYYPIFPVHGHFECPRCRYKTKCCEGIPQE